MGLFSKNTYVCTKCGKEYQERFGDKGGLCIDCRIEMYDAKDKVKGYVDYARDLNLGDYSMEECDNIEKHCNSIFEKYRCTDGITEDELHIINSNYKRLSDEEAFDCLRRVDNSLITINEGASYSYGKFFLVNRYEQVIVDMEDVFAVAMVSASKSSDDRNYEVVDFVVFTNDPYVPVFPVFHHLTKGRMDIMKSKAGRNVYSSMYSLMCKNLKYDVMDIKDLKKTIDSEGIVRGNISLENMKKYISDAKSSVGVFSRSSAYYKPNFKTSELIEEYGYIYEEDVESIMNLERKTSKYWSNQRNKYEQYMKQNGLV